MSGLLKLIGQFSQYQVQVQGIHWLARALSAKEQEQTVCYLFLLPATNLEYSNISGPMRKLRVTSEKLQNAGPL